MVMVRALNGLKNSGAAWRIKSTETLRDIDFVPTVADPDICCRRTRKPNGADYYELFLVYIDNVLCCSQITQMVMYVLALTYDLKDGLVGPPDFYLVPEMKKYHVRSGKYH